MARGTERKREVPTQPPELGSRCERKIVCSGSVAHCRGEGEDRESVPERKRRLIIALVRRDIEDKMARFRALRKDRNTEMRFLMGLCS